MARRVIRKKTIEEALDKEYRQYLSGHLSRPQPYLDNLESNTEVGISYYTEFTADTPHVHPICTEHTYVLQGAVRMLILGEVKEELEIAEGDFFVLPPNTPYATKNAPGTKVLFIKSPGTNDKTLIPVDEETRQWLSSWDASLN